MSLLGSSTDHRDPYLETEEDELLLPHQDPPTKEIDMLCVATPPDTSRREQDTRPDQGKGAIHSRRVSPSKMSKTSSVSQATPLPHKVDLTSAPAYGPYIGPRDVRKLHTSTTRSDPHAIPSPSKVVMTNVPAYDIHSPSDQMRDFQFPLTNNAPQPTSVSPKSNLEGDQSLDSSSHNARKHRRNNAIDITSSTSSKPAARLVTLPAVQGSASTQPIPKIPPPPRPALHHRRTRSQPGNPIVFTREAQAAREYERQVRFHEEKNVKGVEGGECMDEAVDNEWEGLNKGLLEGMDEKGEGE